LHRGWQNDGRGVGGMDMAILFGSAPPSTILSQDT